MSSKMFSIFNLLLVASLAVAKPMISDIPEIYQRIDFRYPNIIVDPTIVCKMEGVFAHPRNCSWYYRCYDRHNTGKFTRAYFECEPGTEFDDLLDQCLFPSYAINPCNLGPEVVGTSSNFVPPIPATATTEYEVKPIGANEVKPTEANEVKPTEANEVKPTEANEVKPTEANEVEPVVTAPINPPSKHCLENVDKGTCSNYIDCETEEPRVLCNGTKICSKDPEWKEYPLCDVKTQLYSQEHQQCFEPCKVTNKVQLVESNECSVTCSDLNLHPSDDCLVGKLCFQVPLCKPDGKYDKMKRICNGYYECELTEGNYKLVQKSCIDPNQHFSFEEGKCVPKPIQQYCNYRTFLGSLTGTG